MRLLITEDGKPFVATGHKDCPAGKAYTGFLVDESHSATLMPSELRKPKTSEVVTELKAAKKATKKATKKPAKK